MSWSLPNESLSTRSPSSSKSGFPCYPNSSDADTYCTRAAHYSAPQAPVTSTSTPLPRGVPSRGSAPRHTSTLLEGVTEEPSTTPSFNSIPGISIHPLLDHLSNLSQKEYFLNQINHDLENTAPLMIEEKLQHLFHFFSLIKLKFYLRVNESISKLIKSEVIPSVACQTIDHVREAKPSLCENELTSLKELVNEKNICSLCSVCDKVYKKLKNLPESMSRASPPHLTHNNPLMNDSGFTCSSPPPAPECHLDGLDRDKKLRHHIPEQKLGQLLNDNDKFPFINHAGVDLDMRKMFKSHLSALTCRLPKSKKGLSPC
ncbi:hypothetical protein VP01_5279g1 [Puccinia sorghi]|uniref:Uncharacterized protein n=1 Tax=Puccinia sorghi TaxID=27349 RepID=A0A0L6UMC1_9BASI|nr:hypothetical protein VP01_5279g1 [Puccinia sorghi]